MMCEHSRIISPACADFRAERRSSLASLPYHHNLDLHQLFDTASVALAQVQEFFQSNARRPVLARRLNPADQLLESVSTQFCSASRRLADETRYLLVLFLQQLYDSIRHYAILECPPIDELATLRSAALAGATPIPHGQVSVSFEKQVQGLRLSEDMIDRIEQFVNRLHRQITRTTRNTSPKERIVEMIEFWVDALVALSHYAFPELRDDVADTVDQALKGIRDTLDLRELQAPSPPSDDEAFHPRNRDLYFWQNLKAGGDGDGKVYKIQAKDTKELFACKVIRYTPSEVNTEQETTLAISRGRHPNIVQVIDTWVERELYFTVCFIRMELCEGDLLGYVHARYQAKQVFSESEIWIIFGQLMPGVEYIHSRGYVHKDIKPKNVLYKTNSDGSLRWIISDFGFSSTLRHGFLPRPLAFGQMTRNYCAPELFISSRFDNKVDIWSAGCILYKLALGEAPFANDEEVRKYAWTGDRSLQIGGRRNDLSRLVDNMVGMMTNISPEKRPGATSVLMKLPNQTFRRTIVAV